MPITLRPQHPILTYPVVTMILLWVVAGSRIVRRVTCVDWLEPDLPTT